MTLKAGGFFFCSRVIRKTDDNETAKVSTALSAIRSEAIIVALSLSNSAWRIAYNSALRVLCIYPLEMILTHSELQKKIQLPEKVSFGEIRTFGYFDVFSQGRSVVFRSEKTKELLALLVYRRGGFVTSSEAISILWENDPITDQTRSRYCKVTMRLKRTLELYGIDDSIESVHERRRIVPEKVSCDLFNYLAHTPGSEKLFSGSYLHNYSWGRNYAVGAFVNATLSRVGFVSRFQALLL